jgi:hypothetical protein
MDQVLQRFAAALETTIKGWKGAVPAQKGQAPVQTRVA